MSHRMPMHSIFLWWLAAVVSVVVELPLHAVRDAAIAAARAKLNTRFFITSLSFLDIFF